MASTGIEVLDTQNNACEDERMVDTTHKPLAQELDLAPIRQKTPTQPPFLADGSLPRPVLCAKSTQVQLP